MSFVKHLIANFKRGKFSILEADRPGGPVSQSTLLNIITVQDMILPDLKTELKQISKALNITYER